jgi:hypothetical protein
MQAEPAHVLNHGGDKFRPAAGGVEVVVAQEQFAPRGQGSLLGSPKGAGMSEVE